MIFCWISYKCCLESRSKTFAMYPACLVGGEGLHLLWSRSRQLCRLGHVSQDEVPLHGLRETPAQDVVHLVNRRAAESRVESVAVEALDVRGVELQPTEGRLGVVVDEVGIPVIGTLADGASATLAL